MAENNVSRPAPREMMAFGAMFDEEDIPVIGPGPFMPDFRKAPPPKYRADNDNRRLSL